FIPAQTAGTRVYYYVEATSVSGKTQVRPMPAPAGYWRFDVLGNVGISENEIPAFDLGAPFPNPAKFFAYVSASVRAATTATIILKDVTGRDVREVFSGTLNKGQQFISVDVRNLSSGIYFLEMKTNDKILTRKLLVR
ncbi:MAG: T9SS type A sorting domain-containing protein, partial [Bacteroidota bacterium]